MSPDTTTMIDRIMKRMGRPDLAVSQQTIEALLTCYQCNIPKVQVAVSLNLCQPTVVKYYTVFSAYDAPRITPIKAIDNRELISEVVA